MALLDLSGHIVTAPSGNITQAMIDAEAAAHSQSAAVDAALIALRSSDPASFETVRRISFADQAAHFGL